MRRILLIVVVLTGVSASVPAARAQTVDEVVAAVESTQFYADDGADVDVEDLGAILDQADELAVVVLEANDPDGASFAAEQVLDGLDGEHTVLVVSPDEVAAVSDTFVDDELDAALEDALSAFDAGGTTADAVAAFGVSLGIVEAPAVDSAGGGAAATPGTEPTDDGGGGGGTALVVFLVVLAAVVFGGFWLLRRKGAKHDAAEVDRARAEIRSQLEVVAHDIVEYEDEIELSENEPAIAHFRSANATYTEVVAEVEVTESLTALAALSDRIDRARWELEAARALMEGREAPPEPEPERPAACFFDPTHQPGIEECTLKTGAGDKEVLVCRECAEKLERGEQPDPRMIDVGGRRVPAAKAPRSHGGLGMGGLSIFEVILGGLGALAAGRARSGGPSAPGRVASRSVDIDWGEMLPKRRPRGDVLGPDRLPPRPRGLPRSRASRPVGSSRRSRGGPLGGPGRAARRR